MTIIEHFCEEISIYYPNINEFEGLYVANCVVNSILAVFTVVGNATIICALMLTARSLSPSKILLLGLAISDLGVGLVVQPLHIIVVVEMLLEGSVSSGSQCNNKIAFLVVGCFFAGASFFIVSTISFDRFLASSTIQIVCHRKKNNCHSDCTVGSKCLCSNWIFINGGFYSRSCVHDVF